MRCIFFVFFQLVAFVTNAQANQDAKHDNQINEERFVRINGIEQWITIKGDSTKPVVLFLHGGPGSPLSPYADAIYGRWRKNFTLVQWDQRGTARTYGQNAPEELTPAYTRANPLSVEQMTTDGIGLAQYLLKYLYKQKLILFASSWGTVLGIKMVQQNPGLFYAYIGHSQIVHPEESNPFAYDKVMSLAEKLNDKESIELLQSIGKPPYDTARNAGRFMRLIKKYQRQDVDKAPESWFVLPADYDNEKDNRHREEGDDYSFASYTGDRKLGVTGMADSINFFKTNTVFKIPIYFIQGEQDIQTPAAINRNYFNRIKAPGKKFILLPRTEHGFNQQVVDSHLSLMNKYILPKISR